MPEWLNVYSLIAQQAEMPCMLIVFIFSYFSDSSILIINLSQSLLLNIIIFLCVPVILLELANA